MHIEYPKNKNIAHIYIVAIFFKIQCTIERNEDIDYIIINKFLKLHHYKHIF